MLAHPGPGSWGHLVPVSPWLLESWRERNPCWPLCQGGLTGNSRISRSLSLHPPALLFLLFLVFRLGFLPPAAGLNFPCERGCTSGPTSGQASLREHQAGPSFREAGQHGVPQQPSPSLVTVAGEECRWERRGRLLLLAWCLLGVGPMVGGSVGVSGACVSFDRVEGSVMVP